MLFKKTKALFNSEQYHGWGRSKRYFEGWYYKLISADEKHALAVIPGIAMDEKGNQQAFIQVLDGKQLTAQYHKFNSSEFKPKPGIFELDLAQNFFSKNKVQLNLPGIVGELNFKQMVNWPNEWYSPGIMGPFSFVPFMECYHGILSMDHQIEGVLEIDGQVVDFNNGRGYMEKDWGHSFPSAYIWMQSNHFAEKGISLKASVAKIPWLTSSFVGFIAGLWLQDRLIQFTTYNFTKLRKSFANQERVDLVMENGKHRLEILAHRDQATELASPIAGFMDGRISESMTSKIEVQVWDKKAGKVLFEGIGENAGLEVAGNIPEITI
jgi:hypothetical protein